MSTQFDSIVSQAQLLSDKLTRVRRTIHANPELSFQEFETAKLVSETLHTIPGMHVQTGVAKTGVIGTLTNGHGPTIAIRADMDALPINEASNPCYRSKNGGVMHACGHDAHTSILLGAAELLGNAFRNNEIQGTVKFIFQPAEENPDDKGLSGAPYMIQEGALEGVDVALALHMCPWEPTGKVQVNDGYSMANVDVFQGTIIGTGGHAAYPHLGTDPIWMIGPLLQALLGIVSRKVSPMEPSVVSVTQIQSGTASNVIPTEVSIRGTLRSYNPAVRELLISEVEKAFSVVTALGGEYTFFVERGEPALKNDPMINAYIKQTIKDIYPEFETKEAPFGLGGEDFGYMTQVVPGAMFFLGCGLSDGIDRGLHTPIFDIDEASLPIGTAILAETAKRFLKGDYQVEDNIFKHLGVTVDGT
jgi:amidohydrolase